MKMFLKLAYWILPIALLGMAVTVKKESNKQFEISKNIEIFAKSDPMENRKIITKNFWS